MNFSEETFSRQRPPWIDDIKAEASRKIGAARFAVACRQGDVSKMRALVVGLWPFIDEFPKVLIHGAAKIPPSNLLHDRKLVNTLLRRGAQVLTGIRKDEENHRKLWLETGRALGLHFPRDFQRPVLLETEAWTDGVTCGADLFTLFLRFAAIEIIAEAVSVEFLAAEPFTSALGTRGCEWFRVHAEHGPGMTHEELEMRLAFAFLDRQPTKDATNSIIQSIVDLFVTAAEASATMAQSSGSDAFSR